MVFATDSKLGIMVMGATSMGPTAMGLLESPDIRADMGPVFPGDLDAQSPILSRSLYLGHYGVLLLVLRSLDCCPCVCIYFEGHHYITAKPLIFWDIKMAEDRAMNVN